MSRPPVDPPLLAPDALASLAARGCTVPRYDRTETVAGTVHVGLGAFARAHVACYAEDLLAAGDRTAALTGASLRSGATTSALAPQDGLYALVETDGVAHDVRVVGAVTGLAPGAVAAVDALAATATTTATLTVTEKGYHHDPTRGRLDVDHPDVAHDLAHPDAPRTAPGVLVAALRRRHELGRGGLTVVSCDNLPANGVVTAAVVGDLAAALDPDLADWIAAHVAFPSSVVDRIVPATTDEDRRLVAERLGVRDAAPVRAEPHRSWVLETAPGLPAWHRVGAVEVRDVEPWQARKLRLVNGPHSALAYLGALAGHATIDAAATDPALAAFVAAMVAEEVEPTLRPLAAAEVVAGDPTTAGLVAGGTATLARFANPALGHRTRQVAADGSQKLRPRILDPLADGLAGGSGIDRLAAVVAAWMAWVATCAHGSEQLDDPLAAELSDVARTAGRRPADLAAALLAVEAVVDPRLAEDPRVRTAVTRALGLIDERGAIAAARALT